MSDIVIDYVLHKKNINDVIENDINKLRHSPPEIPRIPTEKWRDSISAIVASNAWPAADAAGYTHTSPTSLQSLPVTGYRNFSA